MEDDENRHPVIVDTDALIAVADTDLWERIVETLQLTTTNVCYQELSRHVRETAEHAPEGTRERRLHHGSKTALKPFDDDETDSCTVVTCVPRPHGQNAGETSLQTEIDQHIDHYRFAILMDKHGRRSINRIFDEAETATGRAVPCRRLRRRCWRCLINRCWNWEASLSLNGPWRGRVWSQAIAHAGPVRPAGVGAPRLKRPASLTPPTPSPKSSSNPHHRAIASLVDFHAVVVVALREQLLQRPNRA